MKILKYLAFLLGGVVAMLALVILVLTLTFDAARVKSEVIQYVKDEKQRQLTIADDLELSFWPSLGVNVGRSTLSERGSDAEFAAVDHARVSVALLPLLRKKVVVGAVDLDGLLLNVVRDKNGHFNFDDLLAPDKEPSDQRFEVAAIRLRHGHLSYRDEATGRTLAASDLELSTGRLANAAQGHVGASAKISADAPKAALSVNVQADYRFDLDAKQFELRELLASGSGEALDLRALSAGISAARLELDARGAGVLETLRVDTKATRGQGQMTLHAEIPKLAMGKAQASGATASGSLSFNEGRRSLGLKMSLVTISVTDTAVDIAGVQTDIDLSDGDTRLRGSLSSPVTAAIAEGRVQLPKIVGEVVLAHPGMPKKTLTLPLSASLSADFAKSTAVAELVSAFDDSKLSADFKLAAFQPPALEFALALDRLDVDRYLPPAAPAAKGGGDTPVDFSALQGLDLSGTVKIGALQFARIKAKNIRLSVRAAKGRLDLSPMSAQLYDGALSGTLSAQAADNRLQMQQTLRDVSVQPLLKDALQRDLLEGRGNIAMDVATAGSSVLAMKKQLSGSARVALRDGAVKGLDITRTLAEWKRGSGTSSAQAANSADKTVFTELTASFRISNGVARNDDLSAKSPFLRLSGAGDIDIGAGSLNYLAKASVVATTTGQGGKDLAKLKGITVPLRLSGPFDHLSYRLEVGDMLGEAVKANVAGKVGEAGKQIQEKAADTLLKGGLKGLFK